MPLKKLGSSFILTMTFVSLTCTAQEPIPTVSHLVPLESENIEPEAVWHVWPQSMLSANSNINSEILIYLASSECNLALPIIGSEINNATNQSVDLLKSLRLWCQLNVDPEKADPEDLKSLSNSAFPEDYQNWMHGTILIKSETPEKGIQKLMRVNSESTRYAAAQRDLAAHYSKNDQQEKEIEILTALLSSNISSAESQNTLIRLSKLYSPGPDLYQVLRQLWTDYPASHGGKRAAERLASFKPKPEYKATDGDKVGRANALMSAYRFDSVISEHRANYSELPKDTTERCQLWYAFGRSLYKKNQITEGAKVLTAVGKNCTTFAPDEGAKSYYIAGKCLERKKHWLEAANRFAQIPEHYPEHTMGDDGYALAGVAYQIAGNSSLATESWTVQVSEYPNGDLLSEGYWRLAWNAYLNGDTTKALYWSKEAQEHFNENSKDGYSPDPVHRLAQHYWGARWKLYPDVESPKDLTTNETDKSVGIAELKQLVTDHPTEFYALLAAQRLYELEPEFVSALTTPSWIKPSSAWQIPAKINDNEQIQRFLKMVSLGLPNEALKELRKIPKSERSSTVAALETHVEAQINPVIAHDRLHRHLKKFTISEIPDNRGLILKTAYPNTYWNETQTATDGYSYDSRIFHALVREESSFNKDIVSWAGAKGLSQLMPATARRVAQWLSISVNSKNIFEPLRNLKIGARYLEYLHEYFSGNSFMAVGAYNAGEGNMSKWYKAEENPPTDELIEAIPIRETRGYVKRVLGTFQSYHAQHDGAPLYIDWSRYNHKAKQ